MVLGLLAFFSHPLTAEVYIGGLVTLWVILYLRGSRWSGDIIRVAPIFLALVLGLGSLNWYLNGNHALLNPYYLLSSSMGVLAALDFLRGGYTSNLVLLSLAAFGLLRVKYESLGSLYIGVLYAVSGLCFLFLNNVFRFRMLIVLPLGLAVAIGLVYIFGRIKSIYLKSVFTSFVLLFFVVYLLRSMANLI
jgi:hypothetical protein